MHGENFHIGRQIARVISERGMMKCVVADKLGVSQSTMAHLTKRDKIDAGLLQRIGNVLGYNFFKHYAVVEAGAEAAGTEQKEADKERVMAEQAARLAELEREVAELRGRELLFMKQSNEDLRKANEALMATMRQGPQGRQARTVRRNLFG